MLIPLALFVSLLVATAFIAHWSDNLGKKLGKKRVSVFGLRPRTSATLLTVASSWCIMIFTLGALLITVVPLRNALFYYESDRDKAIKEVKAEKEKVAAAQSDAQTYRVSAQNLQGQTRIARQDFQKAKKGEQDAIKSQREAASDLTKAQNTLAASQNQLTRTRSNLTQGRAELADSKDQVRLAQNQIKQSTIELKTKQEQVKAARANLKVARLNLETAEANTKRAEANTKRAEAAAQRIAKTSAKLQTQNVGLEVQNDELRKQGDELRKQTALAKKQAVLANQQGERDFGLALQYVATNIVIPVDQTLAERRFDTNGSPEQVERQLRILKDAAQGATTRIAPNARIIVRTIGTDPSTGKVIDLNEEQTMQSYARLLTSARQPVSARLVSALNYPANPQEIYTRFVFVPIRTIYSAQENIVESLVDANKSESAIFGDLQRLVDAARFNAVKRDANPPLSPDEQNFFDGDTGQKLFNALREVQKHSRPVSVRIVAARDLDSAEPLQVRFLVGDQTA